VHHLAAERGVGFVQSRRVDKDDLAFRRRDDALNAIARRLRFVGDDRNFLPDDAIYKRRLTRVRPADDRDESCSIIGFLIQYLSLDFPLNVLTQDLARNIFTQQF
jgi:hypothetical protein